MIDHVADEEATSRYADSWRVRQRLVLTLVGLFFGYLPLAASLLLIFRSNALVATLFFTWVVGFLVTGTWLTLWPCPRCSFPFHLGRFGLSGPSSLFRVRCVHCGLARQVYTGHGQSLVRGELDDPSE
jgi:hypothetical protein